MDIFFRRKQHVRRKLPIRQPVRPLRRNPAQAFNIVTIAVTATLCFWTAALFCYSRELSTKEQTLSHVQSSAVSSLVDEEEKIMDAKLRRIADANLRHVQDTTTNATQHHHINNGRSIVWLLSFPNSGTSYTSQLVRESTRSMTATNYADELNDVRRVFPNQTSGPFWIRQDDFGPPPSQYVLVKTHCGMRCADCSYVEYTESTYSFRRKCTITKWRRRKSKDIRYGSYSTDLVQKAVHLVRSPFDNVISRFHLLMKKTSAYPATKQGFLEHCLEQDQKFADVEIQYAHFKENPVLRDLWMVPCHAEFCKYVEWHNLALFVAQDLQLSTLTIHYEQYAAGPEAGRSLLDFLELDQQAPFTSFELKHYDDYFSSEERLVVKRAFQFMASRQTWGLIQRYLPP